VTFFNKDGAVVARHSLFFMDLEQQILQKARLEQKAEECVCVVVFAGNLKHPGPTTSVVNASRKQPIFLSIVQPLNAKYSINAYVVFETTTLDISKTPDEARSFLLGTSNASW